VTFTEKLLLGTWIVTLVWVPFVIFTNRKVHPQGLFFLFFAELWERFSFYGMRALLVLYMTQQLMYADDKAYGVYAAYGALVYLTPVAGGMLADRVIGYRKAIMIGAVLMSAGHFAMAIEQPFFFYGALALLICGNGFFKPNISSLVGKLYPDGDARRDAGFTLFYMGINVGAALSSITCGYLGEKVGWHWGFGLAGVGMLIGLVVFWWSQKNPETYGEHGFPPEPELLEKPVVGPLKAMPLIYIGSLLSLGLFALLVIQNQVMSVLLGIVGGGILLSVFVQSLREEKEQRERLWVVLILAFFTALFWAFFEQAGSSMSLFTDRNVDRFIMGDELPTSAFQSLNPGYIIFLAPAFSWLWTFLGKRGLEPNTPVKFGLGILQLALGFFALVAGAAAAEDPSKVGVLWLCLAYLLHTTGELSLSPVGLSMVTKLSPKRMVGLIMGVWFLSSSFAHNVGGIIAALTANPGEGGEVDAAKGLQIYSDVFSSIGWVALGAAVIVFALSPLLKKWMHGIR
jgi:POT family proton-dependent oligopeptide transporter